jgi:hypothetical protein
MKYLVFKITCLILLFSQALLAAPMQPLFFADGSRQALLRYEFYVEVKSNFQPTPEEALEQAQKQAAFLFGTFDRQIKRSSPRRDHKISILKTEKVANKKFRVHYSYEGTIQTEADGNSYSFDLPLNPDEVFYNSLVIKNNMTIYPCGDEGHPQPEYFWYFFNPRGRGCPLKLGVDYEVVTGSLDYLPNTQKTYPEYSRLVKNGQVQVDFFYGMDNPMLTHQPEKSNDYNANNFRAMKRDLLKKGYQSRIIENGVQDNPYIEEFTKEFNDVTFVVRLFFGGTDLHNGFDFHQHWQRALQSSSLVIYAGHSGLGSYLGVQEIENNLNSKLVMPADQYQILFMNGCSSYPYYGDPYFQIKGGTQNLDIITNGLATLFAAIDSSNKAVFNAVELYFDKGVKTSYQKIIAEADSYNLIAVNGDEDNPTN